MKRTPEKQDGGPENPIQNPDGERNYLCSPKKAQIKNACQEKQKENHFVPDKQMVKQCPQQDAGKNVPAGLTVVCTV